jgi:hypothetical protein
MRQALVNENSDLCAKNDRYVMRITGGDTEGQAQLSPDAEKTGRNISSAVKGSFAAKWMVTVQSRLAARGQKCSQAAAKAQRTAPAAGAAGIAAADAKVDALETATVSMALSGLNRTRGDDRPRRRSTVSEAGRSITLGGCYLQCRRIPGTVPLRLCS